MDLDAHLEGIVAGDQEAFALWLAGAEPLVRASLRRFAADVDTEAVVQEALLRVWQVAPRHEPDGRPDSLLRLCFRIARNLAIDEARRSGRATPLDQAGLERALAAAARVAEHERRDPLLRRLIEYCRDKLPAKPAAALAARLKSGGREPDQRLAERLGMRLNTFLQNFTRARKMLAECLRARGVDPEAELP